MMKLLPLALLMMLCGLSGCAAVESLGQKAEALIAKVDEKVEALKPAIAAVEAGVASANASVAAAKLDWQAKADALALKGAPVDGTVAQMAKWAAEHPGDVGGYGSLLTVLAGMALGMKRKNAALSNLAGEHAALAEVYGTTQQAFKAVVTGVERLAPDVHAVVTNSIALAGGEAHRNVIDAVKSDAGL